MTKLKYKLLKVDNVVEPIKNKFNSFYSSYTKSCEVLDQHNGDIIKIDLNDNDELKLKIIEFVDINDCCVGDEFNIK